jgi:hypothetical protein
MKLKMIFNFICMRQLDSPPASSDLHESRCQCGNLLARLRREGVELKCRRCKRLVVIPWGESLAWHDISVQWQGINSSEVD